MTKDIDKIDTADSIKKWSLYTVAAVVLITGSAVIYSYTRNDSVTPKPTDTKEILSTSPSAVSATDKTTESPITQNSKPYTAQKEIQAANPSAAKESATVQTEPQTTGAPATHIQQHTPAEKTTPDVKSIQPEEKATPANPCLTTQISADISSKPTCTNESTGSILIPQVRGGATPYTLSLDHTAAKALKESYSYLSAGTHTILITDKNGCSKEFHVSITEKNCKKTSYVFAPEKGETWKISGNDNADYTITILNMAGTQVYKSQIMSGEFEWQGIGQHGEYLSAGLYIYLIEYTNGQKENGQVTIVR
ncbi:gliding motility-associated C-terminal domain-containing protein [Cytophaga aurantiaca]|uniref:T9SS type B sorting domain-containing protein n=1 Tax=Cytophaga aurantiaca TaxID=29530 RepID=UPI003CCBC33A